MFYARFAIIIKCKVPLGKMVRHCKEMYSTYYSKQFANVLFTLFYFLFSSFLFWSFLGTATRAFYAGLVQLVPRAWRRLEGRSTRRLRRFLVLLARPLDHERKPVRP